MMSIIEKNADNGLEVVGTDAPTSYTASATDVSVSQGVDPTAVDAKQEEKATEAPESPKDPQGFNKDYRFWLIMFTLCFSTLLASLESTVVITSLPTIVEKLQMGKNYIWVVNAYFLTSTAVMPLFAQLCNLFGRKKIMMFIFAAYTLGSGICGGANGGTMLIAGRAVQGIGSGGLTMASEVIIGDIVPLRYRGNYVAAFLVLATVGYAVGPWLGGTIVDKTTWRWIFYLNLPVGGLGIVVSYLFLNLKYNRNQPLLAKLRRIDYGGNAILMASTVSILIALTWGGAIHPWSDARVLVPLILGIFGLIGFMFYEASSIPAEPVMPLRLFANRTAQIVYLNSFINALAQYWAFYFLPLYFQAVLKSSPTWSGVQILPVVLIAIPGAAVAGMVLSKIGKFKILHIAGFILMTTGIGLLALLNRHSSTAAWVLFQAVAAIGSGLLITTLLPAFQAASPEIDQAAATGTWNFIRSFGYVWGVSIAGAIFNTYASQYAHHIDDPTIRGILSSGDAYASATKAFVDQIPEPVQSQVIDVFSRALQKVFLILVGFMGLSIVVVWFEKDIPLREELNTEFGMEDRKTTVSPGEAKV